jgi:hypothetical protein
MAWAVAIKQLIQEVDMGSTTDEIERLERARELFRKNEQHYTEILAFINVLIAREKQLKKTGEKNKKSK